MHTVNTDYKTALVSVLTSLRTSVPTIPEVTESSTDEQFSKAVASLETAGKVQDFANDFTTYALTHSPNEAAHSEKNLEM
ncbi:MAG: hypothetical protein ACLUJR_11780 [Mediterraneibacter gnavus]